MADVCLTNFRLMEQIVLKSSPFSVRRRVCGARCVVKLARFISREEARTRVCEKEREKGDKVNFCN